MEQRLTQLLAHQSCTCRLCEAAGRVQSYRVYLIASSWVVVKILLIVVVIAIVAGLYWLLRRSVLRDEQASRQRLKRGIEAWRAGGGVSPPSGFRGDDYSGFYNTGGYSAWSGGGSDDGGGN